MPKQPFGFIFSKGTGQSPEARKRIKDFQDNAKQQAITGLIGGMGVGVACTQPGEKSILIRNRYRERRERKEREERE